MAELIGAALTATTLHRSRSWLTRKVQTGEIVPDGRVSENGAYLFDRRKIERLAARMAKEDARRLAEHPDFRAAVDAAVTEALQAGDSARAAS